MSLSQLKSDESEVIEAEVDYVGSSNSGILESGLYPCFVKVAYLGESSGGAITLNIHLNLEANNREFKTLVYLTSGKAKGQKKYFEKDGKKSYLPGFNIGNSLCQLTVDKAIGDMVSEEKFVKIYDFDAKEELPVAVPVLTELLNKPILAGIVKQLVDKPKNMATEGQPANWQPSGETKEQNEITKFFRAADGLTTTEILAGATEASYRESWKDRFTGVTQNKVKGVPGGAAQSAAAIGTPAAKPVKSIFAT